MFRGRYLACHFTLLQEQMHEYVLQVRKRSLQLHLFVLRCFTRPRILCCLLTCPCTVETMHPLVYHSQDSIPVTYVPCSFCLCFWARVVRTPSRNCTHDQELRRFLLCLLSYRGVIGTIITFTVPICQALYG